MKKFLILLVLVFTAAFAFSSTPSRSLKKASITDEMLLCEMESVGMDDYGQVYYHHIIFYDCNTGVQSSYYDVLANQFVIYCITRPAPWGCN